jgi:hypothetical protein
MFTYFTWKTLSNHIFEDLRKPKAPNRAHKKTSKSRELEKGVSIGSPPIFFSFSTLYHKRSCRRSYISTKHGALSKAIPDNEGVIFLEKSEPELKLPEEEPYQMGPKKVQVTGSLHNSLFMLFINYIYDLLAQGRIVP